MTQSVSPTSNAMALSRAYIASLQEALGSRDPFSVLRSTPNDLLKAIEGLSPAQLAKPEAAGKWSVLQVVQHLAQSELVGAYRFRMILAQDRPPLIGYDQNLWVDRLGFTRTDAAAALAEFTMLRSGNLGLLEPTTQAQQRRVGIHAERGEESITQMIRNYAGHDVVHLRQIARIRRVGGVDT